MSLVKTTYLIVPGNAQSRIVARDHEPQHKMTLAHYRADPDSWHEVGLMNSSGRLVCLQGSRHVWDDMQSCEPLSAPMTFTYDKELT